MMSVRRQILSWLNIKQKPPQIWPWFRGFLLNIQNLIFLSVIRAHWFHPIVWIANCYNGKAIVFGYVFIQWCWMSIFVVGWGVFTLWYRSIINNRVCHQQISRSNCPYTLWFALQILTQGHCHRIPHCSFVAFGPHSLYLSGMTQFSFMRRVTWSSKLSSAFQLDQTMMVVYTLLLLCGIW